MGGGLNSTQHRSLLAMAGSHCIEEEVSLVRQLAVLNGSRTAPIGFLSAKLELTTRQKTVFARQLAPGHALHAIPQHVNQPQKFEMFDSLPRAWTVAIFPILVKY